MVNATAPAETATKPPEKRLIAQVYVRLDGKLLSDTFHEDLLSLRVEGSAHLPDLATLVFNNPDLAWTENEQLKVGQELKIALGDEELNNQVFVGEITAIELDVGKDGGIILRVRAYDRAHRLHRGRRTRVFKQMTDSDIAKAIASDAGLKAAAIDGTNEVHEYVLQDNQTNWEFLQARAARLGMELQAQDKTLVFKKPPGVTAGPIELTWRQELTSFQARMTTGGQVSEVEVRGWDPVNKKAVIGVASVPQGKPKIGENRKGGDVAERAFNKKATLMVARQPVYSQAQADELAQSVLDDLESGFITAEGEALGNPQLRLGSEVTIKSVGKQFSGKYLVTQIAHVYDSSGYRIEFEVTGRRSTDLVSLISQERGPDMHVMTGIVTNNKDDRNLGRVKVKLPVLGNDVESHWCRLVSVGVGKERGMQYLPEVDDEVLVMGSDINNLYVLGGLWNAVDAPPLKTSDAVNGAGEVIKRLIRSRTGHEILLDDSPGGTSITIVDSTGKNKVVIDTVKKGIDIFADADITLKAGQKITIDAGTDLTLKAGIGIDASASMDAKLSAGVQLSLEGAMSKLQGNAKVDVTAPLVNIGQ